MDAQEVKDRLKNVFINLVKDDNEAAKAELHDVLSAKMRDRVSPPEIASHDEVVADDDVVETDDDTPAGEE